MKFAWIEDTIMVDQEVFEHLAGEEILSPSGSFDPPQYYTDDVSFDPPQYEQVPQGTGNGTVVGINRGAQEGEREGNVTPQELLYWLDVDKYKVVDNALVPLTTEEVAAIDNLKDFEKQKEEDAAAVRATFDVDSEAPVEVTVTEGTFTFNGGQDSASYIDGAMRLAQQLGETEVVITDVNNEPITLSFESTSTVVAAIGVAFRTAFMAKQAALVEIQNRIFS